jgi:DedD protein
MADRIVENADQIVDEMKRKARRRLVGAIVLALAAAIILPMLLEKEPRPLGDDVSVKIPPVDEGKFVNRLTGKSGDARALPKADEKVESKPATSKAEPRSEAPTTGATPATAAAPEANAAKKSVAEAEQRALSPAKTSTRSDAEATPAANGKSADSSAAPTETKSAAVETKPLPADAKPADEKAATTTRRHRATRSRRRLSGEGRRVRRAARRIRRRQGRELAREQAEEGGLFAFVEPVHTSRGTLWRVRVGGYGSKPEADAARVKLKGEGYSGIVAPAS